MAAKGGGGSDPAEGSTGIIWMIAAIFIFGAGVWYVYRQQLIKIYFKVKIWEIDLLSLFTNRLEDVRAVILKTPPEQFTFHDVVNVGNAVGEFLRIPIVFILFVLALIIYFANSTRLFKRVYTMKDLAQLEKQNWPQITPVLGLDLNTKDIDKGPWAMALTPMQFCKRFHLLDEHKAVPREGMTRKEWDRVQVTLRRSQAHKLFALQLGPAWKDLNQLSPHARALFAVFAARFHGDSQAPAALLSKMSASSVTKVDYTGVEELIKKYSGHKRIQQIMSQHAYVLTMMASMLEVAREDGVQASADFLWIKPIDRRLWYMLNTVGRQTPFAEVAGPFAHWIAEKQIGRRLLVPMVEEATNALEISLKEIIYRPDEE